MTKIDCPAMAAEAMPCSLRAFGALVALTLFHAWLPELSAVVSPSSLPGCSTLSPPNINTPPLGDDAMVFAASPVNGAGPTVPVLLGHGQHDRVVDPDQSWRYARKFGDTVHVVSLPDEGHILRSPANLTLWYAEVASFLRRHLGE